MCKLLSSQDFHHQRKEDADYKTLLILPTSFDKDAVLDQEELIFALQKVERFYHCYQEASFLAQKYRLLLAISAPS